MPIWSYPKDRLYRGACVYLICSPEGQPYVGQTIDFKGRMRSHKCYGNNVEKHKKKGKKVYPISKAISNHGWQNMEITILEKYPVWDHLFLDKKEQFFIRFYNSYKGIGYNCNEGGNGGSHPCSEETKQKLSKINKGIPKSEEFINNLVGNTNASGKKRTK